MTDTPDSGNVVPPTEIERRRRVLQCTEDIADLFKDLFDRALELRSLDVAAADWMDMVAGYGPPEVQQLFHSYGGFFTGFVDGFLDARLAGAQTGAEGVAAAIAGMMGRSTKPPFDGLVPPPIQGPSDDYDDLTWEGRRMERVITRLFKDAPKMTDASGSQVDESQAPALICHVMLKAGGGLQGTLSVTPEGTLRLATPNTVNGKPVIVEHFFDYEQVADIAVFREVNASMGPRIITS